MYKYCIVPKCSNTTFKTPDKLFFNVPRNPKLRKKWYSVIKRDDKTPPSNKTTRHCCEDHFDIENDMENYMRFKMMGGKIILKKGAIPHKFECQEKINCVPNRSARRKRKRLGEKDGGSAGQQDGADGEENYILVVGGVEEAKRVPPLSSHQPADQEQSLLVEVEERTNPSARDQPVEAQQVCQDQSYEDGLDPEEDVEAEEMTEVKIEVEEQCDVLPDPLLEDAPDLTAHQSIEAIVKEEPLDIEVVIDQGDPSPEQEMECYRELYNKVKEDVTRLEVENQRLADENQLLSAKLHGFTNRIEDLLQTHEKRKATSDEQAVKQIESVVITNLKMDKRNLTEENSDLKKQVNKQTEEIKELTQKNKCLSNEIQELSDVNKQLTVKLEVFSKDKNLTRTAEDVYVFVQKIKILSDDVKRLTEENETLRQEIEDLTRRNKGTTDRIIENVKGTYKFKIKHTSDINEIIEDEIDTDDNVANKTHKMKRKRDLKHIHEGIAEEFENVAKGTRKMKRKHNIHINEATADEFEECVTEETHKTKRKQDVTCRSVETSDENVVKEIVKSKRKQEMTHRNTTESSEDLEPNRRTRKRRRKT